jgi:hypothetical protein
MKQGLRAGLGASQRFLPAAGAAVVVMLVASQGELGVPSTPPLLAAELSPARYGSAAPPLPARLAPIAPPSSLPVEVVLSHVVLTQATILPRAQLALPISFGRPIAPEDDISAPPAHWHHHHHPARQTTP